MFKRIAMTTMSTALLAGALAVAPAAHAQYYGDRYDRERCYNCGTVTGVQQSRYAPSGYGGYGGGYDNRHYGGDRGQSRPLGAGAAIGAVIGGVLGNQVGGGNGRKLATVAGAIAGGAVGHSVQKRREGYYGHNGGYYGSNRYGRGYASSYRVNVRMDDGRAYSFDQANAHGLRRGDRVEIRGNQVVPFRGYQDYSSNYRY